MNPEYVKFLTSKAVSAHARGMTKVPALAKHLFPFQSECVEHHLRTGTAGTFLDTGLGKTEIQLEWCQHALIETNGRALILTPLAVAGQTKRRAEKYGYEARIIREQSDVGPGINICNYDRLDKLDPSAFGAISLDEASVLKSFTGKTTRALIEAFKGARFKLAATATPAPNDHMELGNYAEFLEIMAANEMLSRFFINDTSTASQQWRIKGHAENAFWDWMASWARMAEKPSDITGNAEHDRDFILPPFEIVRHRARDSKIDREFSGLFGMTDNLSATNIFALKRQTAEARAEVAASVINRSIEEWLSGQKRQGNKKIELTPCGEIATPQAVNTARLLGGPTSRQKLRRSKNLTSISDTNSELDGQTTVPCSTCKTDDAPSVDQLSQAETENFTSIIATKQDASEVCSATITTSPSVTSKTTQKTCDAPLITSTAERMPAWVLWCDTNDEQKMLENALGDLCISIRGSQSADEKEALHEAWLNGARPVLITKPSMFGFGCDWSHCANMAFVGRSYSYETWYQAVRRCWRFGQKKTVKVHLIVAEGEAEIGRVIDRKADDHGKMKTAMREAMRRATGRAAVVKAPYQPNSKTRLAPWISAA